jgi:integrase
MRRVPHLQRRGDTFYLRVRVPEDLREAVGRREVVKSLGTTDISVAREAVGWERTKLDGQWANLRAQRTPTPVERLSEQQLWYLVGSWFVDQEKKDQAELPLDDLHEALLDYSELMDRRNLAPVVFQKTEEVAALHGLNLQPGSQSWHQLEQLLGRAIVENTKRRLRSSFPSVTEQLDPQFSNLNAFTVLQPVATISITELIDRFDNDPMRGAVTAKTRLKRDAHWRSIKEFFGPNTDIASVTRLQMREFVALLQKSPSNATKHFPTSSLMEAAAKAEGKKLPLLSIETANGYLRSLGGLFRFAVAEGYLAADPTLGLQLRGKKVAARHKRLPFSSDDLTKIFNAPLYRGCLNDGMGYAQPGPRVVRRGRFWIPLISLFTGMRLNEICQLTLDDFSIEDETDVILIRGDEDGETKRVKTDAGNRFVPVHSELKAIGLLEYVEEQRRRRKASAPVFPEIEVASTGYRSDNFSKFFARFLDHVGIKDRKKVFHSFRHNYRDALREADLSIEKVRALGGWESGKTEDHYGSGLRPSTLAQAIADVRYPELDLSHLHADRRA